MTHAHRNLLTPAAYARHRGLSRPAVAKALREGRITATADGLIDPVAADAQWLANTRARVSAAPPAPAPAAGLADDEPMTYNEAKRRQAVADMGHAELLLRELRGELVRVDAVRREYAKHLTAFRESLLTLPARLGPVLAAESDQRMVHDALQTELFAILAAAADAP